MKRLIILGIIAALITTSCRKDIILDLHNSSGLIVIEGWINNKPGPYFVGISKTVTYYDSSKVIPVLGAHVVMTDDAGNRDSLLDSGWPGLYMSSTITGVVGRTYHLSVSAEGKQYDAYSTMPAPVTIDSIGVQAFSFGSRSFFNPYGLFSDPAATTNYYKLFLTVNNKKQSKVVVTNDNISNGKLMQPNVGADNLLHVNDTIQVELDAVDKPIYEYWNTLNRSTLSSQTIAPANPQTNFSNNALGYFSAYSFTTSHHVVIDQGYPGFHRID